MNSTSLGRLVSRSLPLLLLLALDGQAMTVPPLTIAKAAGPAELVHEGQHQALKTDFIVADGDDVVTGAEGRASLRFEELTMTLGAEGTLRFFGGGPINNAGGPVLRLLLSSGALRVDGRAVKKLPQDLRLNVGELRLRVLGSDVWVSAGESQRTICLLDGALEVQSERGSRRLESAGDCLFSDESGWRVDQLSEIAILGRLSLTEYPANAPPVTALAAPMDSGLPQALPVLEVASTAPVALPMAVRPDVELAPIPIPAPMPASVPTTNALVAADPLNSLPVTALAAPVDAGPQQVLPLLEVASSAPMALPMAVAPEAELIPVPIPGPTPSPAAVPTVAPTPTANTVVVQAAELPMAQTPPPGGNDGPKTGGWTLVALALVDGESAGLEALTFTEMGLPAVVRPYTPPKGKTVYRVTIGSFATRKQAQAYNEQLKTGFGLNQLWIAPY